MRKSMRKQSDIQESDSVAGVSCDWRIPLRGKSTKNRTRILRYKSDFRWSGIKAEKYKQEDGGWAAIVRNVLIGSHGESARFHLRYFEIAPGGHSSLEKHNHEHVIVCIRGKGKVLIEKRLHSLYYLDTVYVAPGSVHQLRNPFNEPFGFFCIVNAKRDRPKPMRTVLHK